MFNKIRTRKQLLNLAKYFKFVESNYLLETYELHTHEGLLYRAWVYDRKHVSIYDNKLHLIPISKRTMKKFINKLPDSFTTLCKGINVFS